MMQNFEGKTAFVTGGASGIGLSMAQAFGRAGMNVAICDIQTDRLENARKELEELGDRLMVLTVDTTKPEDLEGAAAAISERFGNVHILCNNAGIGGGGKILESPEEKWRKVMEVNVWGPLNGVRAFLPGMMEHGEEAHVVITSSFSGIEGHGNQAAYGTSKFAMVGFSEFLRNDMQGTNVGVSVLCPHVVDTPMFYPDVKPGDKDAIVEKKKSDLPWLDTYAVPAEEVGEQVLNAIRTGEFYIFCDGTHTREMLENRVERIVAAMDRQFPKNAG